MADGFALTKGERERLVQRFRKDRVHPSSWPSLMLALEKNAEIASYAFPHLSREQWITLAIAAEVNAAKLLSG